MIKVAIMLASTALFGLATSSVFADVRIDKAVKLQEPGKIKSFDTLDEIMLKQPPSRIWS